MSLRGSIGTRRRRRAVAPRRIDRERRRLLADPSVASRERQILADADVQVHPEDAMYVGDAAHYLRVGLSAYRCIEAAGIRPPRRILDLPCGHGRVLRMLRAAYPDAELVACDVDRGGADFCAERFGAVGIYSSRDLSEVELPTGVDLVWCGSLATHLDASRTATLLAQLARTLAPGGRLVVTTHGQSVAERLAGGGGADYQLEPGHVAPLLAEYRDRGFGYANYPWSADYGFSLVTPDWVRENAPLPVVHFSERCWDDHQDVYVLG